MQSYWNETGHDVKLKSNVTGEIIEVKNGSSHHSEIEGETFKVKYPTTGWRKL